MFVCLFLGEAILFELQIEKVFCNKNEAFSTLYLMKYHLHIINILS
jgi:hypothetical protein